MFNRNKNICINKFNECINSIKKYSCNYENCDEDDAQLKLKRFFEVYISLPEQKDVSFGVKDNYYSYLYTLLLFRQALIKGKYGKACHELSDLCDLEPIIENRIRVSLIRLYKEYLE